MWFVTKVGKEKLLMDLKDVYAVMSRGPKETDIYCTIFPEGITVDHNFDDILASMEHMESEDELEETEDEC